ncbi:MAG: M3 family metallopeptidase [Planctomycetes bacterium]|nr:M3 family metallopeptidase [Planctomycetota bacterium]
MPHPRKPSKSLISIDPSGWNPHGMSDLQVRGNSPSKHPRFKKSFRRALVASLFWTASTVGTNGLIQIAHAQSGILSLSTNSPSKKSIATQQVFMNESNPFFAPSKLPLLAPDFDAIQTMHFLPAFESGMKQQLEEMNAIADQNDPPTFSNTLIPMERSGEILTRVSAVFFNLASAHTNPEIQKIEEEIAPKLAAHSDDIHLNKKLFARIEILWNSPEKDSWSEEQRRLLQETYEDFVRAGAKLSEDQQARVRAINEQLSSLETQFQNNLLAITKERAVLVDDVSKLEGMSESEINAAKQAAAAKGQAGKYLIAITNTTRQPVLTSLRNREMRRQVWLASANRAIGESGGLDNQPIVLELAKLRAERAKILGYPNHAAFTLENQMANDPKSAFDMLRNLVPGVVGKAMSEALMIEQAMKADGVSGPVEPWDWEYYAEKVRAREYEVDENSIKPYFELESVLKNGVFYTFGKLYGVEFRERKDLPVWHPTVRVFDVLGTDGKQIGLFYADYFQRDSKRGGAWMDSLVAQSRLLNRLPVVVNVMNIPEPAKGEPTLLSLDHVTTMFHELGHGVHGLFSSVEYPSLSGTSVPRDYVEFPSTFHEDWAIEPEVLTNYARHYQTGETIPKELLNKAIAANKFNKGYDTLEYLAAALLDLGWHSLNPNEIPKDAIAFENELLRRFGVDYAPVPPRYRTTYFAHAWSGGYSAGYYAYLWSEVLAADAFAFMKSQRGLTPENGKLFREKILSRGGTREVMQQYIDFRGSEPKVDALLIRRGLKQP